jgi:hypothetical protein
MLDGVNVEHLKENTGSELERKVDMELLSLQKGSASTSGETGLSNAVACMQPPPHGHR